MYKRQVYTLLAEYMLGIAGTFEFEPDPPNLRRALAIEPRSPFILNHVGWNELYAGNTENAYECFKKAKKFGPFDPMRAHIESGIALTCLFRSNYEDAILHAKNAISINKAFPVPYRVLAAAEAMNGDVEQAGDTIDKLIGLVPNDSIERIRNGGGWKNTPQAQIYIEGLQKAGLPLA